MDHGAEVALRQGGKSLLAVGIRRIEGRFQQGDLVSIVSTGRGLMGKGLVEYSSNDLEKIIGARKEQIEQILGRKRGPAWQALRRERRRAEGSRQEPKKTSDEVIHRDNMVILSEE